MIDLVMSEVCDDAVLMMDDSSRWPSKDHREAGITGSVEAVPA